jgi:DNA-binding MarR family transcriptional regulator
MPDSLKEQEQRLLARVPVIQTACDLDLLVFLHRHPRALLTTEQLAGFIGYDLKDIVKSLDAFVAAGLLDRTNQPSTHAARLFVLSLAGTQGRGTTALIDLGSTRQGRERILGALARPA